MQPDPLQPEEPPKLTDVPIPQPTVAGGTVIQPLSDHIVVDPIVEQPRVPGSPPPVKLPPAPSVTVAEQHALEAIKKQRIATIVIILIGLYQLASSALFFYQASHSGGKSVDGLTFLAYIVQAVVGFGLLTRKELFRWFLMIFSVFFLIYNLYTAFVIGAAASALSSDPGYGALFLVVVAVKVIPLLLWVVLLNLKSVKSAFN